MAKVRQKGRCYICGKELGKIALRNHIMKEHMTESPNQEDCLLIRAEDLYDKDYWLYFDIPLTSEFIEIDYFLRRIWLECCGHLSEFRGVGMYEPIGFWPVGSKLEHIYDFGSSSRTILTAQAVVQRQIQDQEVRLLGRNLPLVYSCSACGQPADFLCDECSWEGKNHFFCKSCLTRHEHDEMLTPVTNSPRMGICAYCGESDFYG